MFYSKKVIQHFKHPHNQGLIKNADAMGEAGNPICGDVLKIYLKIRRIADNRKQTAASRKKEKINSIIALKNNGQKKFLDNFVIKNIKFETLGCAAAIAVSSALTVRAKNKTLTQALKIKKNDIIKDLGGLPIQKTHCSMLGIDALKKAIVNYQLRITNYELQIKNT